MTRRPISSPAPTADLSSTIPLGLAIALMDDEAKQRIAVFVRGLAAARLGLDDPFSIVEDNNLEVTNGSE